MEGEFYRYFDTVSRRGQFSAKSDNSDTRAKSSDVHAAITENSTGAVSGTWPPFFVVGAADSSPFTNGTSPASSTSLCYRNPLNALTLAIVSVDSVSSLVTIVGNALVIVAIWKYRRLLTVTNTFVLSLAAADLMVGINVPFYVLFYFNIPLVCGQTACQLRYWFSTFTSGCSMLGLIGVAVDRYIAIMYPLKYRVLVRPQHASRYIYLVWIYIAVISSLPLVGPGRMTIDPSKECDLYYVYSTAYAFTAIALHVLLTFLVTTVLYVLVFREAWKHTRAVAAASDVHCQHVRQETKTAKTMFIVLGAHFLGFFPYLLAITLRYWQGVDQERFAVFKKLAVCFYFARCAANPFIYGWMNRDFRIAFRHLLLGSRRRP